MAYHKGRCYLSYPVEANLHRPYIVLGGCVDAPASLRGNVIVEVREPGLEPLMLPGHGLVRYGSMCCPYNTWNEWMPAWN